MRTVLRPADCLRIVALLAGCLAGLRTDASEAADRPFPHEIQQALPVGPGPANDVRAIAVESTTDTVWIATAGGAFRRSRSALDTPWISVPLGAEPGPTFAVATPPPGRPTSSNPPPRGAVWIGAWNGLHRATPEGTEPIAGIPGPVVAVAVGPDGSVLTGGPDGYHLWSGGRVRIVAPDASRYLGRVATEPEGSAWWLATGMGLYRWTESGGRYVRGPWTAASIAVRDVVPTASGDVWAATLGGLQGFRRDRLTRQITPANGLPSADIRCVALDALGRIWAGTDRGLARLEAGRWVVRHGRRWLPNDEVRGLAFDAEDAAWIATAEGVGVLGTTALNLEEKARRFHAVLEARHVRPPGIVEKCALRVPGDLATWEPMDDDNDGGYTALALAMESYRFAVTGDPAAREAARRAFAACEFLQHVTGTPGFLARTVVPADWKGEVHDPNETFSDAEWADRRAGDPRNKRVPERWRRSADGRWRWKGDTSSDEMTAHFYGYFVFHELAADAADRLRVRTQVCRLADHLIDHGFTLTDLDGRPTRWGVWAPERLNGDPDWAMERGINSVEILSYLKVAGHVSGDPRYETHYRRLVEQHGYARNAGEAPNLNPAWRTYIDFELLAFAYPALLKLETDPRLHRHYRASLDRWHREVRGDGNPFFEFIYADLAGPSRANLAGARAFLRDTPLDLVRWSVDNTLREDVARRRHPEVEHWQTARLLPVAEIGYSRTDQNPWRVQQGDGGRSESDGVFWLLPYWMGRHLGHVPRPE